MKFINLGSISKNLTLLVVLAVLPALAILLYTGMEQRHQSIENAQQNLLLITGTIANAQSDLTSSAKLILSTLSLLPEIRNLDIPLAQEVLGQVIEKNPDFQNITLTALDGTVLASGRYSSATNLSDRKHVREAIANKSFAVGEYIISRVGETVPAFAFACPVLDRDDNLVAVLTIALKLARLSRYHDEAVLPEKSFIAVTDHNGVRLFYFPAQKGTNPVGKPIKTEHWEVARKSGGPGFSIGKGSDGLRRVIAFEPVRLTPGSSPYLYVWAGIPEANILGPANAALYRNLVLMFFSAAFAAIIACFIGKNSLITPIKDLVNFTGQLASGKFGKREPLPETPGELGVLTRAFYDMADELERGQRALQENESRFRLIMDSIDAIVYVADMDSYEVLFINQYGKQFLGDITGQICWQTIQQGQDGPCPFCTNKYLLDAEGNPGEIHTWEFQNTITGSWFYIHDRAITWIDGRIVRLEIATDMTERKQFETRLAEETERLAVTLRSIGDGVITTDTEGQVTLINQVAETLTGWSSAEATGRPLSEVFHIINEVTGQPCESPVEKVLASGQIIGLANHTSLIAKNGQGRNIADSGAPIRDRDGKIIGVVLVFRDITDSLRTEQELIKAKKLESIGVLAGGIAHDFNNILAAILGNLDLSLLDANISDRTRRLLGEAVKASYRARDLTQQLLTFAKGGQPIKEAAALPDVIRDSADFILRGDKVACRYHFPDDLWLVDIDKGQISQVVQNIILNASNAMPSGGIVDVTCENVPPAAAREANLARQDKYVKMTIKDSGVGIPANVLDKIFDPYFTTKQQGNGLGLAITHSIISKHEGHISVRSTPGIGSTFTIYLPASAQVALPDQMSDEIRLHSAKKARILLMDDEEQVQDIMRAMLSELGHDVLIAADGTAAVRTYSEQRKNNTPIDLVIMDLTVPGGMGGKDAAKEVLAIDPQAKLVVSSGYSHDPVMANFRDHGFRSAITKPCQLGQLARIIEKVLAEER